MIELPLQVQLGRIKGIASLREAYRHFLSGIRLCPDFYRFAYAVHIDVYPNHGPSVFPVCRLQMYYSSQRFRQLEMIEPPFTFGSIYQCTLMRSVDIGRTFFQYHFLLVWTVDVFRTQNCLPSLTYSAFGNTDIVISVPLVKLGTFCHRTGIDHVSVIFQGPPVGAHLMQDDRSGSQLAPSQISLTIVIPYRARVFPSANPFHTMQR